MKSEPTLNFVCTHHVYLLVPQRWHVFTSESLSMSVTTHISWIFWSSVDGHLVTNLEQLFCVIIVLQVSLDN